MGTQTPTRFDVSRFCRAAEERDAHTQVAMYAPDADWNFSAVDAVG